MLRWYICTLICKSTGTIDVDRSKKNLTEVWGLQAPQGYGLYLSLFLSHQY